MDNVSERRQVRPTKTSPGLLNYPSCILQILILLIFLLPIRTSAQLTDGITNIADTSFSTNSAYLSSKKKYPEIKIAQETHSPAVKEKYGEVFCEIGERKLMLDVFSPLEKTKKKRTAVIIIFGGGWRSGNRTQHYPLAEKLAALGYVCFTPEYRLSTEALYPAAVYDVKASVRWVKKNAKKYNVDTSRISILGFSAGGMLAALTSTTNGMNSFDGTGCNKKYASDVHALIDIDGTLSFVHPESGEGDESKKRSAATYWFGYYKKDSTELWRSASPLTYAGAASQPTLFINSSVDRMHAGRNDYIKVLDQHHIYNEVKTFENSPHSFCLFDPWFEPTVKHIDEFLKKVFN